MINPNIFKISNSTNIRGSYTRIGTLSWYRIFHSFFSFKSNSIWFQCFLSRAVIRKKLVTKNYMFQAIFTSKVDY